MSLACQEKYRNKLSLKSSWSGAKAGGRRHPDKQNSISRRLTAFFLRIDLGFLSFAAQIEALQQASGFLAHFFLLFPFHIKY